MPLIPPRKRMYVIYNHMPGGQMCVQHFDHVTRERRLGDDKTERIEFTPEEQIRGFEKSDFVALNLNGILVKNKVLVYTGTDLVWDDPHSKIRAAEWAADKGIAPVKTAASDQKSEVMEPDKINKRFESLEEKIDKIMAIVERQTGVQAKTAVAK